MPTGKHRPRPQKKKIATRTGFNLKQLRKKIDELKKQLERHASNTEKRQAQFRPKNRAAELSPNPEPIDHNQGVQVVSEGAAKPEGKREQARRMMLARIARARSQPAIRSAEANQLSER